MTTRTALLRAFAAAFAESGMEAPEREARALLRGGLGLTDLDLVTRGEQEVAEDDATRLRALAERRTRGEPLARLTGRREFWSLDFSLSPETLVPRPETETLVEVALSLFPDRTAPLRLLDLGTGSGALLAALLSEYPTAFGVGVDLAPGAARQARANLAALEFATRAAVLVGHWGEALVGGFDLVVSNPPYIPSTDIPALQREVRTHDPLLALDGGPQGLDAYRALTLALPGLLVAGGYAVLELGIGQERQVAGLLTAAGLTVQGPARADLAGIARAIIARKA
ncbi:peptide chain release factor N(5)-glutamine methyltransferase [Ancylobacter polymorphus]|uniref:Release factor glutamine methyltransferase n=1 Tax=Ancylobacter polymorphus TaxID=223390 RepID=A0A9E6ZPG3_9HYPH|nr:peptide chain release factor N(5)-glutamine methyltransferase [Ancylobacter polymorphus]UOK69296.1 peptide chain release factor N(5)-glutamine methyltransferase [Ancylobacter polymorphus]